MVTEADEDAVFDVLPPVTSVQKKVSEVKDVRVSFPSRVGDVLSCDGVQLRPASSGLGPAGRLACASQPRAAGVWRGSVQAASAHAAATRAAAALLGAVALDPCGVLANCALASSALHFLPSLLEEPARQRRRTAGQELAGDSEEIRSQDVKVFVLAGGTGQVLSHCVQLFLYGSGSYEALLRLQPLNHVPDGREPSFQVDRQTPLGANREVWCELAMVELPRLFQLSMSGQGAVAVPGKEFLVEEDEEVLVINAWHRLEAVTIDDPSPEAISQEQLLWCETLRALSETPPCAEASVPAARVILADEGVASYEELLDSPSEEGSGVPKEDAARLASLAFLRQYASRAILEEEGFRFARSYPEDSV
ncbi:unnamed protein product [Effrenium voratum]|nr:unnamed protein product [Effrenium voratum]